jgi:hypothetical protein
MSNESSYKHVQHAPLCLQIYVLAVVFLVLGLVMDTEPPIPWLFPPIGLFMLVLAASFHHLAVEDQGDRLSVSFGPIPLFRRSIQYDDIISAEIGCTTVLDGWGIHMSLRGGWVWNLWGRDCVVLQLRKGVLRIGTDDAANVAAFVRGRIGERRSSDY